MSGVMNIISASSQQLTCPNYVIVGNVGIGTTNPLQALDVTGAVAIGGITVIDSNRNITANTVAATTNIFNNNVGIGTTVPAQNMHVYNTKAGMVTGACSIDMGTNPSFKIWSSCSDASGNLYVTGHMSFSDVIDLTLKNLDGSASSYTIPYNPFENEYNLPGLIIKYNLSGLVSGYSIITNVIIRQTIVIDPYWGTTGEFIVDNTTVSVTGIASDSLGNIYAVGYCILTTASQTTHIQIKNFDGSSQSTYKLSVGPRVAPNGSWSSEGYIVKYNSLGVVSSCSVITGAAYVVIVGVCTDAQNNIYVTGRYTSTVSLPLKNIDVNMTSQTMYSLPVTIGASYVIKYNSSGIVSGMSLIDGPYQSYGRLLAMDYGYEDFNGSSVSSDLSGNVYVSGTYTSSTELLIKNMDGSTNLLFPLPIAATNAGFLVKYNSSGVVCGTIAIDGTDWKDNANSVCTDTSGNVYITGQFRRTSSNNILKNMDGTTQTNYNLVASSANLQMFLVKYNSNGVVSGASTFDKSSYGISVISDSRNNVYVGGRYRSTTVVPIQNLDGTSQASLPISTPFTSFIIKFNSIGVVCGVIAMNNTSSIVKCISVDNFNNVYAIGQYITASVLSLTDMDGAPQSTYTLPISNDGFSASYGYYYGGAFVVKYTNYYYNTTVNSTGYIGIGTTAPLQALDVRGTIALGGVSAIDINRQITTPIAIFSSNVGIGTTVAITPLHVVGSSSNIATTIALPTSYLPTTSNLTVWYNFEGSIADKSGNANTPVATGTMRYITPGKVGGSAIYLANEANVTAGTTPPNYLVSSMSIPTIFTVSLWANLTVNINPTRAIMLFITNNTGSWLTNSIFIDIHPTKGLSAGFYGGADLTTYIPVKNTWYHLCITVVSGVVVFYINGAFAGTCSGTLVSSGFMIGNEGPTGSQCFAGYIDDFRIYNRALSATEIQNIYSYTNPVPATPYIITSSLSSGLITHLPFDGGLTETSGATLLSVPAVTGSVVANASYVAGKTGTACLFLNNTMGGNHLCQVNVLPSTAIYALTSISISLWAMASSVVPASTEGYIFNIGATGNGATAYSGLALICKPSNLLSMWINTTSNLWAQIGSSITMTPGLWYHLVVTYNNANIYLYVNGSSTASVSGAVSGAIANGGALRLGDILTTTTLTQSFAGYIDDFRVYNRVLSAAEILLLYQIPNNQLASTSGLYGQWKFENNLLDSSGNGFNGVIQSSGATYTAGHVGTYALSMSNVSPTASNLWVDIPMSLSQTSTTPYSLSAWINPYSYPTTANSIAYISSFILSSGGRAPELYYNTTGGLYMSCYDSADNANTRSMGTLSVGQWSHVAMSWGDGSMRAYLNGVQTINANTISPLDTVLYNRMQIGIGTMNAVVSGYASINGDGSDYGFGTCTDPFGNVYVTGYYVSTPSIVLKNMDGVTNSAYSLPGSGLATAFVTKYNSSGVVQGYFTTPGQGYGVCTDSSGNVYATGQYSSSSTVPLKNLDGTTVSSYTLPGAASQGVYIIKYNLSGIVQGFASIDGTAADTGYGISTDSSRNVYAIGQYNSTSTIPLKNFDGTTVSAFSLPATSGNAMYTIKYNSSGVVQGYVSVNGTASDTGSCICVDSSGNVYVAGSYISTSTIPLKNFDGTTVSSYTLPAPSAEGAYVIKYNSSGVVQGYALVDGTSTYNSGFGGLGADGGRGLCSDALGNTYLIGYYITTVAIALKNLNGTTATGYTLPTTTGIAIYIIKYSSTGIIIGSTSIDGDYTDYGNAICTDSLNNVYATGSLGSTTTTTLKNLDGTVSNYILPIQSNGGSIIIKYNYKGFVQGHSVIGGGFAQGRGISAYSSDTFYVIGNYMGAIALNNMDGASASAYTLPGTSGFGIYVIKYTNLALNGAIDDVRLYNHILTQAEVTDLYTNANYVTTSNTALTVVGPSVFKGALQVTNTVTDKGRALWGARITGGGDDIPTSICVMSDGGFVVSGTTTSAILSIVNADGSTSNLTPLALIGVQMGFLVKYTASGMAQWVAKMGSSGTSIQATCVTTLIDDSIVVLGQYNNSGTSVILYNADGSQFATTLPFGVGGAGAGNILLAKYSNTGAVQWATRGNFDYLNAVLGLADGSVVFAVNGYQSVPTMYSTDGTNVTTSRVSVQSDGYLVKMTPLGVVSWWARVASTSYTGARDLIQLTDGSIVVTGFYWGTCSAYNGGATVPGAVFGTTLALVGNASNTFVIKYSNAGVVQWVTRVTTPSNTTIGYSTCATTDGGCVVTGAYGNYASIYSAPGTVLYNILSNVGASDSLIVKYNSAGVVQWATRITNTTITAKMGGYSTADGGHILAGCLTGGTTATIFNSDGSFTSTLTTTGTKAGYIAKFSSTGMCVWATKINGGIDDRINSVVRTADNGILIVGQTNSVVLPLTNADGTMTLPLPGATVGYDGFIAKYNDSGTIEQAAVQVNSTTGYVGIGTTAPIMPLHTMGTVLHMNGNVGIDTATPVQVLDVVGAIAVSGVSVIDTSRNIAGTTLTSTQANTLATSVNMMRAAYDTNSDFRLKQNYTVAGNVQYEFWGKNNAVDYNVLTFKAGKVGIATIDPTAYTLVVTGTTGVSGEITALYSDMRLKTDIVPICNAIENMAGLQAFTYMDNALARSFGFNEMGRRVGLSAQEVQAVLPEAVKLAPFDAACVDGIEVSKSGEKYLTVQYEKIVPLLVAALKEKIQLRRRLELRVRALEG